jgi:hypothetical protein
METLLLSTLPLLCILASLAYAAVVGTRVYKATGFISVLGVAAGLLGAYVGRFLDRFIPLPRDVDDWVNYRGLVDYQVKATGERYLAILSVEAAVLFLLASAFTFLAVNMIRRDALGQSRGDKGPSRFAVLGGLFILALCLTYRGKLAACLAFLLAKAGLL